MAEITQQVSVNPGSPSYPQSPNNKLVKPLVAYSIIISSAVIFFVVGVFVGKTFFWQNYSTVPIFERKLVLAQERVNKEPKNPQVHVDLGWAYFQKEDYNKALVSYKKAIELDKEFYPAYLNIGLANMQLEKWDVAIESLNKASDLNPKSSVAHANLGISLSKKGQFDEAIKHLEASEKLAPGSIDVIYNMALAYEGKGQIDEAIFHLQGAAQFDPENEQLQKELKRLQDKKGK